MELETWKKKYELKSGEEGRDVCMETITEYVYMCFLQLRMF